MCVGNFSPPKCLFKNNERRQGHCGLRSPSFHLTSIMPVRKAIPEKDGVYFITFTCTNWLPLFKICNGYDAVYTWFDHLKKEGHYIIGYVIMPSHAHAIIAFSNTGKSINAIVSNGKRSPSPQCLLNSFVHSQGHCGISITKAHLFFIIFVHASTQSHTRKRWGLLYNLYL